MKKLTIADLQTRKGIAEKTIRDHKDAYLSRPMLTRTPDKIKEEMAKLKAPHWVRNVQDQIKLQKFQELYAELVTSSSSNQVTTMNDAELIYSHESMITDQWRKKFFHTAIKRHAKDKVVLDVGSGTGILSFYALEAGASYVYAVETDPVSARVTQNILSANFDQDRFEVLNINFWTYQLDSNEFHRKFAKWNHKIDVLVSETIGPGLFDQGWLQTVDCAKPLLSDDAVVIPDCLSVDLWLYEPSRLLDSKVNKLVSRKSRMISSRFADTVQAIMTEDQHHVANTHWLINKVPQPPLQKIENVLQHGPGNMPGIKRTDAPFPSHILPVISFDEQIEYPCTAALINKISFESDTLYLKDAEAMPWRWQPVCSIDQPGRYLFTYNNPMLKLMPSDEWQCHKID